MTKEQTDAISYSINLTLTKALPELEAGIMKGVNVEDGIEHMRTQMLLNCISLSVQASVQIVMDILDTAGVIYLPTEKRDLRKLTLRIHRAETEE